MVTTLAAHVGRALAGPFGLVVRVGRRPVVGRVIGPVLIVAAARALAGVWAAAVVAAVVLTAWLLAGWAAVERRVTARVRARSVVVERGPRGPGRLDAEAGHVAFARGLVGLAGWYLAECERQEREVLR